MLYYVIVSYCFGNRSISLLLCVISMGVVLRIIDLSTTGWFSWDCVLHHVHVCLRIFPT
jgi:hypothetical protein